MDNFIGNNDDIFRLLPGSIKEQPNGVIFRFKFEKKSKKIELIYVGNQYKKLLGVDFQDAKDPENGFINLIHPDDRRNFIKAQKQALNKIDLLEIEMRILTSDKSIKWIYVLAQPIQNEPGIIYWDGFIYDISKRKIIEQELLFAKESIDANLNPIYWFDKDSKIIYSNQSAWEMLGYTEKELYAKRFYQLSLDYSVKNWPDRWLNLKNSKTEIHETLFIRKNGGKIPVEISTNFFTYKDFELVMAFITDITPRFETNKKILYRQQFEKLILNISTRFINITYLEVDQNIDLALQELSAFMGSDSSQIYVFNNDLSKMKLAHFYSSKNIRADNLLNTELEVNAKSKFFKIMKEHKIVIEMANSGKTLNNELKDFCSTLDIKSCVDIGMFYQNKLIGFIGLGSEIENRGWSEDELNMLQIIGDIFINAVKRKESIRYQLESEHAYREIYNATSEAITIHDPETGKIEDANRAMLHMFGITYAEALTSSVGDLSNSADGYSNDVGNELIRLANEEPQVIEWQAKRKNGELFWIEASVKRAIIHGIPKVLIVFRDISERKKTDELLKESEEKYRMIIESQNDLIIKINSDNKFIFVSPSFCRLFKKSENELLGHEFLEIIHDEDKYVIQLAMEKLYKPPYTCFMEQRAITKDGWRWLSWNHTAVLDENCSVKEIIGIGRDITYQKMVENALRESEERFRSIVQNLSDVVFLIDEKGIVKYVTPSCTEYLGVEMINLLGKDITELVHQDDHWQISQNIQAHLSGSDQVAPFEVRIIRNADTWKMFEVKSHNMLRHPAVHGIVYTLSDITERKIMEKQVLDAIIKTEEKERERFAKDLHDDLGPLLSSIKMYIGMLNKAETVEKREFIVNNLNDIVKEAIATTKEVSNDMNPHVLNNYGLVSAIELFINKISTDIKIEFDHENENARYSPAIELSLYRIIKELMNNTLKHSNATKIFVKIREKDAKLSLFYEDNGQGISESKLKGVKTGGMGLSNIISRAKSLNAIYNFHTNISAGFKFDMHVPLIQE